MRGTRIDYENLKRARGNNKAARERLRVQFCPWFVGAPRGRPPPPPLPSPPPSLSAAAGSPSDWLLFDSSCRARRERDKFLFCFPCVGEAVHAAAAPSASAAAAFRWRGRGAEGAGTARGGREGAAADHFRSRLDECNFLPRYGLHPRANDLFLNIRRI